MPILVAAGVVLGILVGSFFASHFSGNRLSIINTSSNKINDLFHLIDDEYVDSVNVPELVEKSMPQILKQLDPHSIYISAKDVDNTMKDLRGSFSGIGVQFTIYNDTVRIIRIIKGGPSESVGLRAGDRIIRVDGKPFTGASITNDEVLARLKGPSDSRVKLEILRPGEAKPVTFDIVRGTVPVKSITAAALIADSVGYIRINSFGETTYPEFLAALAKLGQHGFSSLVLDLRGNLGGYMEPAVQIANEFLPKNRLIVYTEGRRSPRQEYRSDGRGTFQTLPLVVLIDETSASSSEILSGAIQDNDRGTIVGRRSFGKGLVQVPIQFDDGSMLRLTKSRYYTPAGRCVQKPYAPGQEDEYEADLMLRAVRGEYQHADSIKTAGQQEYTTRLGRVVYGGGGIIPDVFIPDDTTNLTS
ncbi:MAG: S41 family peptidase, partial [Alloprevotella sp.]|nr:S41 family peptidase [Alloprevotella sp.]